MAIELGTLIGQQLKAARKARGNWSQDDLLAALDKAGLSMSRQTLGRLEKGDPERGGRPITVQELLLLAFVLGVPPASLVTPTERTSETVAVTDKVEMPLHGAYQWLVGIDLPLVVSRRWPSSLLDYTPADYATAKAPYEAWLTLRAYQRACTRAYTRWQHVERSDVGDEVAEDAQRSFAYAARNYERAMREVRSLGLTPPALGATYALDIARALGRSADVDVWLTELGLETFDDEGEDDR
jgi:transcriptional regulator with XRE-family HTH domain